MAENENEFEKLGREKQLGIVKEFFLFITQNKKWWLVPILLIFAAMAALLAFSSSGAAPFIYTLF